MRISVEGKLILCFMSVLCAVLGFTCVAFIHEMHERLGDIMGEQARQLATSLSLTSERLARSGDWDSLTYRAQQLIKARNIPFIGYLDSSGQPVAVATRDLDFGLASMTLDSMSLMQVNHRRLPAAGDCLSVTAPIFSAPSQSPDRADSLSAGPRLLGYVTVGVSQAREEAQIYRVQYLVIGISSAMVLLALPMAFLLVHRIFMPIRSLVTVTRQITGGNLDARTDIHRRDTIGELARSFDEMALCIKQQQQELEHKVDQRTSQLESANKRLSAEITEKEEFVRAVSHDLNAPLRNISGMVTMLLNKHREEFDEEIVRRLERIKSNVEIETDLICELLELSRIKTRRLKIEMVDVVEIVDELRDIFESDLRSRAIDLCVDTPLPVLEAERMRIRQIFQNLVDNAIKYMGTGPVREIHVGCVTEEAHAEFYVRDTGIGIDEDDLAKVFMVFRRGKNSVAQNVSGKGVGLASVKSIVENYNGTIWVTSQSGKGTTFHFTVNGKFVPQPNGADKKAA